VAGLDLAGLGTENTKRKGHAPHHHDDARAGHRSRLPALQEPSADAELSYTEPANLERLRARGLSHKRSLALREFALGVEALERFVRGEPLRRVHECVFGVLALESEPVDPRL
jgi:hypothetical protein